MEEQNFESAVNRIKYIFKTYSNKKENDVMPTMKDPSRRIANPKLKRGKNSINQLLFQFKEVSSIYILGFLDKHRQIFYFILIQSSL